MMTNLATQIPAEVAAMLEKLKREAQEGPQPIAQPVTPRPRPGFSRPASVSAPITIGVRKVQAVEPKRQDITERPDVAALVEKSASDTLRSILGWKK